MRIPGEDTSVDTAEFIGSVSVAEAGRGPSRSQERSSIAQLFEISSDADRLLPMEGMRGFAALLVFFVHFHALFSRYIDPAAWMWRASALFAGLGHAGVDVFFVLSGYLIYGILLKRAIPLRIFIWRRVRRLFPVFLVVLAISYVIRQLIPGYTLNVPENTLDRVWYFTANVLMLAGIVPIRPIMAVAWSLSYELFFYFDIALAVRVLMLRDWRPVQRAVLFSVLSAAGLILNAKGISWHPRLIMFLAGVCLWEFTNGLKVWRRPRPAFEPLICAAFGVTLFAIGMSNAGVVADQIRSFGRLSLPMLFVSTIAVTLYGFFAGGFLTAVFSWDYLRWMGNISYSFYLVHGLALHCVLFAASPVLHRQRSTPLYLVLFVVGLAASIITSAVLFLVVEKPLSLSRPRRAAGTNSMRVQGG